MHALYELPAGYALFKVVDADAGKFKLAGFQRFKDTAAALEAATSLMEGKAGPGLQKFLKKSMVAKGITDQLAVQDPKIGKCIKDDLGVPCVHDESVQEIFRAIGHQVHDLIQQLDESTRSQASLALAHNIARYKLKFSPDKIDLMIIQAIALMEDLDKELNTYMMRVKEWYGWHFPEMQKIVKDNVAYAKVVAKMQRRGNAPKCDFSSILDEETEKTVKDVAAVSMGADIADEDIDNVTQLAQEAVELQDYRNQLSEYLRVRMEAIAPNLTLMVGELVGAKLVSKAGSLIQLAKHPSSTVQLLGAEKALFKALKARQETPKYGLIYGASLVGVAPKQHKGKIARVLAAKTSLAARIDSFTEASQPSDDPAANFREAVERRLTQLDSSLAASLRGKTRAAAQKTPAADKETEKPATAEAPLVFVKEKKDKKKKREPDEEEPEAKKAKKEKKKEKKAKKEE